MFSRRDRRLRLSVLWQVEGQGLLLAVAKEFYGGLGGGVAEGGGEAGGVADGLVVDAEDQVAGLEAGGGGGGVGGDVVDADGGLGAQCCVGLTGGVVGLDPLDLEAEP